MIDPVSKLQEVISNIEKQVGGVISSSSPLSVNAEACINMAAYAVNEIELLHRRRFAVNATSKEELYPHLSDKLMVNAYAGPSTGLISFLYSKNYVINNAVKVDGTNYRKMIIPKYSTVAIDKIEFILPTTINFIVLSNGSLRVEYDVNEEDNLVPITSNAIDWKIATLNSADDNSASDFIFFKIPMLQCKRRVYEYNASENRKFEIRIPIVDQFYHCNVYTYIDGKRLKLNVSLTEEVKDLSKPTAIVKGYDNDISVTIPLIYLQKNMIGPDIEIEVYVTKGKFNISLGDYSPDSYSLEYGTVDYNKSLEKYFKPILNASSMSIFSDDVVTGGFDSPTFKELYDYTIYGVKGSEPINQNQLNNRFTRNGYRLTLEKDDLLSRLFVATKELPRDTNNEFNTGIGSGIVTMNYSTDSILSIVDSVIDNDKRITLLPGTIINNQGTPYLVAKTDLPERKAINNTDLANIVNKGNYAFLPFFYVIDTSDNKLDLRAYHLEPKVVSREAKAINEHSQYSMNTIDSVIERTSSGYTLTTNVKISENINPELMFAQLSYIPVDDSTLVYLVGNLVSVSGTIAKFKFHLKSNFDIDRYEALHFDGFSSTTADDILTKSNLTQKFNIIYGLIDSPEYLSSNLDNYINPYMVTGLPASLTHETVTLMFGIHLKNLWNKSNNIIGSIGFDYHTEDVPYVYEKDIPLKENDKFVFENVNGKLIPVFQHRKGEQVVIDGEPQYRYRKGSVKRDPVTLEPLIKNPDRYTERSLDFFVLDANYYYSDVATDKNYLKNIISTIVSICQKDMVDIAPDLGENTIIQYYPQNSLGYIDIIDEESVTRRIDPALSFKAIVYLDDESYKNDLLKDTIKKEIKRIIADNLSEKTVSTMLIAKDIKDNFVKDIISLSIKSSVDSYGTLNVFSTVNDSDKINIRRVLKPLEDNSLYVEDDIEILFKVHRA